MAKHNRKKTPTPIWEQLGMDQRACLEAADATRDYRRNLSKAEARLSNAADFISSALQDEELSIRSDTLCHAASKELRKAQKQLRNYERKQLARDISNYRAPIDLTLGRDREVEKKELLKRLLALPTVDAKEVQALLTIISLTKLQEDQERTNELLGLLEHEPLICVIAYANMANRGTVKATLPIE